MAALRWRIYAHVSWIWLAWERLYIRLFPLTPVCDGSLLKIRRRGDRLELHLDGRRLAAMRREKGYSAFAVVRRLREELAVLAERIGAGEFAGVTALAGTSLMGGAAPVLGFEARPLPHTFGNGLQQYFLVGLDALYHPLGLRPSSTRRWPVDARMSVEELLRRYPAKSARSTVAR